jgi:hypothetical protein
MQFVAGFGAGMFTAVIILYLQLRGVLSGEFKQDKKMS